MNRKTLFITRSAIIAALYVVLTLISKAFGLDGSSAVQIRISECLCVLPVYTAAAVPGVTVGCLIYNLFFGVSIFDTIFGTLATLIGVLCTYYIKFFRVNIRLAGIPTVIANTLIIPPVLVFAIMGGDLSSMPYLMFTVALGEVLSCCVLGTVLLLTLRGYRNMLFGYPAQKQKKTADNIQNETKDELKND